MQPKRFNAQLELNGYVIGSLLAVLLVTLSSDAFAYSQASGDNSTLIQTTVDTAALVVAAILGALGSYLVFGEDKQWPPSAVSIGHILLGFGAGMFVTRGALELVGRVSASFDLTLLFTFLFAVLGYFLLQLAVAIITHDSVKHAILSIIPEFLSKRGRDHDLNR